MSRPSGTSVNVSATRRRVAATPRRCCGLRAASLVEQGRVGRLGAGHDCSLLSAANVSAAPSLGGSEPCIGLQVTRIVGKEPLPARDPCNAVGARRRGGACLQPKFSR